MTDMTIYERYTDFVGRLERVSRMLLELAHYLIITSVIWYAAERLHNPLLIGLKWVTLGAFILFWFSRSFREPAFRHPIALVLEITGGLGFIYALIYTLLDIVPYLAETAH